MPRPQAALLVDSDSKGLESLVYGFQGAGWRITACPTPETASLLVKASAAKIVVIASRVGHEKVDNLVRQLRGRESFRTLPVLLLGAEELREKFRQFGDVDLLPLPTFVRDVLTAAELLVGAGVTAAQKPGEEPCFEDSITVQGTLSLVRTMNGLARSGSLHLVHKGRHGEILFHEGELTAAQVGQLQGMAAVQHLLVWGDGHLELRLRPVVRRGQMHQTAQEFLQEFERFQRDFNHAIKDIGQTSTVYLVNEERLRRSGDSVPAEVTPVVRLCDGQRHLGDVIDESPFRVLDTVRILARLVELAILTRRDPKPTDASGERTPLDEFWATARITSVAQQATPPEPVTTASGGLAASPPKSMATMPGRPAAGLDGEAAAQAAGAGPKGTEAAGSSVAPSPVPAPGVPIITPSQAHATHTSGTFELAKPHRKTQPRLAPTGPSVVIDTQLVDVLPAAEQEPAHARAPSEASAPAVVLSPAPAPVSAPTTEPAPTLTPKPAEPSAPTPTPVAAPVPVHTSAAPSEPPAAVPLPVPAPVVPVADAGPSMRATGELKIQPSRKTSRGAPAPARVSVQLDASLTEEPPTPNVTAVPVGQANKSPSGRVVAKGTRSKTPPPAATGKPRKPTPVVLPGAGPHRPSGSFSAVESDFFEREADLYKEQKVESFADLDEGRASGKNRKPGPK